MRTRLLTLVLLLVGLPLRGEERLAFVVHDEAFFKASQPIAHADPQWGPVLPLRQCIDMVSKAPAGSPLSPGIWLWQGERGKGGFERLAAGSGCLEAKAAAQLPSRLQFESYAQSSIARSSDGRWLAFSGLALAPLRVDGAVSKVVRDLKGQPGDTLVLYTQAYRVLLYDSLQKKLYNIFETLDNTTASAPIDPQLQEHWPTLAAEIETRATAWRWVRAGVKFDLKFDSQASDRLYIRAKLEGEAGPDSSWVVDFAEPLLPETFRTLIPGQTYRRNFDATTLRQTLENLLQLSGAPEQSAYRPLLDQQVQARGYSAFSISPDNRYLLKSELFTKELADMLMRAVQASQGNAVATETKPGFFDGLAGFFSSREPFVQRIALEGGDDGDGAVGLDNQIHQQQLNLSFRSLEREFTPDVQWDGSLVYVRRSESDGDVFNLAELNHQKPEKICQQFKCLQMPPIFSTAWKSDIFLHGIASLAQLSRHASFDAPLVSAHLAGGQLWVERKMLVGKGRVVHLPQVYGLDPDSEGHYDFHYGVYPKPYSSATQLDGFFARRNWRERIHLIEEHLVQFNGGIFGDYLPQNMASHLETDFRQVRVSRNRRQILMLEDRYAAEPRWQEYRLYFSDPSVKKRSEDFSRVGRHFLARMAIGGFEEAGLERLGVATQGSEHLYGWHVGLNVAKFSAQPASGVTITPITGVVDFTD